MAMLRKAITLLIVVSLIVAPTGCVTTTTPAPPLPANKAEALQKEYQKAEAVEQGTFVDVRHRKAEQLGPKDQLDQWLRVASMAIDAGEPERAKEILTRVTDKMNALLANKEFWLSQEEIENVVGGEEIEGYFWGDPYERMFAYLYLGILEFQAGEYDLARKSFRTVNLMDSTSTDEAFKGDCYLAYLLEGIAARYANDPGADEAFTYAEDAFAFRQHVSLLIQTLYWAVPEMHLESLPEAEQLLALAKLDLIIPIVSAQIPVSLVAIKDPVGALSNAFANARQQVQEAGSGGEKDDPAVQLLKLKKGKAATSKKGTTQASAKPASRGQGTRDAALQLMTDFEEAALVVLTEHKLQQAERARAEFARVVSSCKDLRTNTFFLHQIGQGPAKVRAGKYGNARLFYSYPHCAHHGLMTVWRAGVEDSLVQASLLTPAESIDYQARTRGGREMDQILEGKVMYRDAALAASNILAGVATGALIAASSAAATMVTTTTVTYTVSATGEVVATTTTTTAPGGMAAATPFLVAAAVAFTAYEIFKLTSNAIHPEADFRAWHELPSQIMFACSALEPGDYRFSVESFDRLARPVPEESVNVRFNVVSDKPTLVLTGQPWR